MPSDDTAALYRRLLEVVQRTRHALHADDFAGLASLLEEQTSLLQALQHLPLSPDSALMATIETLYETLQMTMREAEQEQAAIQEQLHDLGSRKHSFTAYIHAQYR